MRELAAIAGLSAAATFGGLAVASSVGAQSGDESTGTIKAPTTSYSNPTNESIRVHNNLRPEEIVAVRCSTEGQGIDDQYTWFQVGKDDRPAFVDADTIHINAETVGHC